MSFEVQKGIWVVKKVIWVGFGFGLSWIWGGFELDLGWVWVGFGLGLSVIQPNNYYLVQSKFEVIMVEELQNIQPNLESKKLYTTTE